MKIDFVINSLGSGGGERVLAILANRLFLRGHSVRIVTLNNNIKDVFDLEKGILRIKLKRKKVKNHSLNNLTNLFHFYLKKKNRPDVVISFMVETSMLAIIITTVFRIKCIASEHTNHIIRVKNNLRLFTRKYLYRLADKIVVLTEFDRKYYAKYKSDAIVIPNPSTFKSNNAIQKRDQIILAVGNLNKYHTKGFDNLIPIVAKVLKNNPGWKLQIIGDIDEKSLAFLTNIAIKYDTKDKILFSGFSNHVSKIMSQCEIFILSSRFEGLPMVLIEALSQGMACISYDCITGPSEIINHNHNGVLVEDQNSKAMQDALEQLILDEMQRKKLKTNAPKSIEKFNPESITSIWEKLLIEI